MTLKIKGNESLILGIIIEFVTAYALLAYTMASRPPADVRAILISTITLCVALIILSGVILFTHQSDEEPKRSSG